MKFPRPPNEPAPARFRAFFTIPAHAAVQLCPAARKDRERGRGSGRSAASLREMGGLFEKDTNV